MSKLLTPDTPPEEIARYYEVRGTLLGIELPPGIDRSGLEAIVSTNAGYPHGPCVLDLVVAHPACDHELLDLVLELGGDSSQVLNTIVTSGKASRAQLAALRESEYASVREHVEMALLEHELDDAVDAERFAKVLRRYRNHETLGYGVRYRLATHPGTPVEVLRELGNCRDNAGELARRRLGDPRGEQDVANE